MTRLCPNCQRAVYSRTLKQCGYCKTPLPDNFFAEDYIGQSIGPAFQAPGAIDRFRTLSLPARLAVGLHCFERYCKARGLRHPLVDAFLDHMWELPCSRRFSDWDSASSGLVDVGLGEPFPPEFLDRLSSLQIPEAEFRELLEATVEIVYCSAYGASEDTRSLKYLERVLSITAAAGVTPPPAEPFLNSLFGVKFGWGPGLDADQRDAWRYKAYEEKEA